MVVVGDECVWKVLGGVIVFACSASQCVCRFDFSLNYERGELWKK